MDLDVAIIGAGHAGLSIGYHVKKLACKCMIFERYRIGNSWKSQRWDTFRLNTPNKSNQLPGFENNLPDPEGFCTAGEFAGLLKDYAAMFDLPVRENAEVMAIEKTGDGGTFKVKVRQEGEKVNFFSKAVVIASGISNKKILPGFGRNLSSHVHQIHASEYKNAYELAPGAVLVAGSAQSGVQIAEDLIDNGRKVFLATSRVGRIPRRYRGKDIMDWLEFMGFNDQTPADIPDPQMMKMKQPQISGIGPGGRTISIQSLARKGVVILGKIDRAEGNEVWFQENAAEHVQFADAFSERIKTMIDDYIEKTGKKALPVERDPDDLPDPESACVSELSHINVKNKNITSIIWATGFTGDFSYLKIPVVDAKGKVKHNNGIADINGLYFIGFPWLRKRKSGIILGIRDDSSYISRKIMESL